MTANEPNDPAAQTVTERTSLGYEDEPSRRIGVRVERLEGQSAPAPTVLLCHGFKGFMDWGFFPLLSRRLARAGFIAVSMNASGCGVGDDPLVMDDEEAFFRDTYTRQLEDMARVREFARALPGAAPAQEGLLGHSRGGGMAVVSAAEDPCACLVTWAAIDESDRFSGPVKDAWRRDGVLEVPNGRTGQIHRLSVDALDDFIDSAERLDILAAAARLRSPLVAIHGRDDGTVPWEAAERLASASPRGRAIVIEAADHSMNAKHPMDAEATSLPKALDGAIEATLAAFSEHLAFPV